MSPSTCSEAGVVDDRIVREVLLPADREEVWEAITRPDRLAEWFGGRVEVDPVPRGRIEHRAPDEIGRASCRERV